MRSAQDLILNLPPKVSIELKSPLGFFFNFNILILSSINREKDEEGLLFLQVRVVKVKSFIFYNPFPKIL